ncbi:MAG: hypothetical protein LBQ20_10680 [Rhodanobacter sp.]|nr:hypothetical protein [Rhodanobacter sp.]
MIRSDVLIESGFAYLKESPWRFYKPILWFVRGGKPALKAGLAQSAHLDVTVLPYDPVVLDWLKKERQTGRSLVLATASHVAELTMLLSGYGTEFKINFS